MSPLDHLRRLLWDVFLLVGGILVGVVLVVAFLPQAHR